jgi:hypothetical protein
VGTLIKAKPPSTFREALKLLGTAIEMRHAKPKRVTTGPCKEIIHRIEPGLDQWLAAGTGWKILRSLILILRRFSIYPSSSAGRSTVGVLLRCPV